MTTKNSDAGVSFIYEMQRSLCFC